MEELKSPRIVRTPYLVEKIVFVDGLPGCGKTMLSPIVGALDRVELMRYAYEIEYVCSLNYLGRMKEDVAATMVRMIGDLQLYNAMMGRETNFRWDDLSSAFRDRPFRYLKRIFQKGDAAVLGKVSREHPILHFTTHMLLGISDPIFSALGDRVVMLEMVRHPLYMLKQQTLNMERLLSDVRHFTIYFQYKNMEIPFWAFGWEDCFVRSNAIDKAIYMMEYWMHRITQHIDYLRRKYSAQIMIIPFERFVLDPLPFMKMVEQSLQTHMTPLTYRVMKKQKVPRARYADGLNLPIYQHCGWESSKSGASEADELKRRRDFATEQASPEALRTLDKISRAYEEKYLS